MINQPPLLSVAEAQARILARFTPLPTETLPLAVADGRVLAAPAIASDDHPPFNNSSMDGYAVRVADLDSFPGVLPVSGDIPAGSGLPDPLPPGTAMRIMTGAPVPVGADAVVPVEDTDDTATRLGGPLPAQITLKQPITPGACIRQRGHDMRAGQRVLTPGVVLGPAQMGVLAALGQAEVLAHRQPRVALFSTGNELRSAPAPLGPGQIRDVNRYTLAAAIRRYGGVVHDLGLVRDEVEAVQAALADACALGVDVIVSSAGVSVGAYDVVKTALETEGALEFWRVQMRPGKPLAFGRVRAIPFFGLPGNPVSALLTFEVFVRPALLKLGGRARWDKPAHTAVMLEPLESDGRESYLRAVVTWQNGHYTAHSAGDQGSAMLASLVRANALLIVPAEVTHVAVGETLPFWWLYEPTV
jgi:molybdopterin molybdotransferase